MKRAWLQGAQRLLSDELMALLALGSVMTTVAPFVFETSPALERLLIGVDLLVVVAFALEYAVSLALVADRRAFLVDPWRVLDAFIIVSVVVSLLPLPTDALGLSPVLRLVRFVRLAILGTRWGSRLTSQQHVGVATAVTGGIPLEAFALNIAAETAHFDPLPWDEALGNIGSAQDDWLYIRGVDEQALLAVAERLQVPGPALRDKLFDAAFPQLDRLEQFVTLFIWYPWLTEDEPHHAVSIRRTGLLLIGSSQNVAVLAREPSDLLKRLERRLADAAPDVPDLVNATHALLKEVIRAYLRVVEHLERRLIEIEETEATLRDRMFLQWTFQLRRDVTEARTTLRHLARVIGNFSSRRIAIRGFDSEDQPLFRLLASDAGDLHERAESLNANLSALADMRLNVSSFQMNKVMRILAILTTLALIPSVAGGMLGMNLLDNPWPATLPEVGFWVGTGMVLSLYLFAIKGWLR